MRLRIGDKVTRATRVVASVAALGWALCLGNAPVAAAQERASAAPAVSIAAAPRATLSAEEMVRLREGVAAADRADYASVRAARAASNSEIVRRILTWRLAADQEAPLDFEEIRNGLESLQGWPGRETMRRRLEQTMFSAPLPLAQQVTLLQAEGGPLSGDGKVALAKALKGLGRAQEANALAREAFRMNVLTPRAEIELNSEFPGIISADDVAARVNFHLFRDERSAASRLLPRLRAEDRAVANARIVLQARPRKGVQAAVDGVPAARRDDPGLLWDRARYVRRAGRPQDAAPIAKQINPLNAAAGAREAIQREMRAYVPRLLRGGDRRGAYGLVANHGLTSGEGFADSEWVAGWIALRYLNDPTLADRHFTTLERGVSAPVSKARAAYWRGEAQRALRNQAEAQAKYAEAAALPYTFYGQLAASKLSGQPVLSLPDREPITPDARAAFESREIVQVLRLMADVGDQRDFESIAFFLDDVLTTPIEHELLSMMARERGFTRTAVRSAKSGLRRGIVAPEAAYPLLDMPADARKPSRPEPAVILAITRQESEFDPRAVSRAGARGLMQLMPATARMTARIEGLPYDPTWLLNDPSYNVTLGAAHLEHLLNEWNGSYVLTFAAYNAGPGNVRQWIEDAGDPRSSSVDMIDWIELIPFSETRNYVHRVMENVAVYRWRLGGGTPTPIRIEQDLRRGAY